MFFDVMQYDMTGEGTRQLRYLLRRDSLACDACVSSSAPFLSLSSSLPSFITSVSKDLKGDFSLRVAMLFFEDFSGEGKIASLLLLKGVIFLVKGALEQLS